MITDDPGTPGSGNWEINIAASALQGSAGSEGESPLIDVNYGLGERVQLKYEVAWVTQRDSGGTTRSGLGDSLVGVKWRFYDTGASGWSVSAYPQAELRNPGSHAARRGLDDDGTGVLLPFQFERTFTTVGVNFEAGRQLRSRGSSTWLGGVALGHAVNETVDVMTELRGESSVPLRRYALAANFGVRIAVSGVGMLLASIGRDLHNGIENRASVFGYLGWQVTSSAER